MPYMARVVIKFYKVMQLHKPCKVGQLYMLLLQISWEYKYAKNYENRLMCVKSYKKSCQTINFLIMLIVRLIILIAR